MLGLLPTDALAPEGAPMEALAWTLGAVRASGGLTGLHCCSAPPWSALLELPLDLMSFDAHADLDSLLASPSGRALAERRWMAWGLVPTSGDPAQLDPEPIAARWRARVADEQEGLVRRRGCRRRARARPGTGDRPMTDIQHRHAADDPVTRARIRRTAINLASIAVVFFAGVFLSRAFGECGVNIVSA